MQQLITGCFNLQNPGLPGIQEKVDLDTSVDAVKRKMIDGAGAGKSFTSPGWLTQLGRLWGGKSVCYYPCLLHRITQKCTRPC